MIDTHFTRTFGLLHPYALAPFAPYSDGRLAAAISQAGGLGLVHAGKLTTAQLDEQFQNTGEDAVGWGVDTARLAQDPDILPQLLSYKPRALLLAGGDPRPYADRIKAAGVRLICVAQSVEAARHAITAETDIMVALGGATAGQGSGTRSTFALLPEVANEIYASHAEILLLAAGGICDPRGIAASVIMGADGVMMGTRLWATQEAPISEEQRAAFINLSGDAATVFPSAGNDGQQWRGIGPADKGQPMGEGVGLINSVPGVEALFTSLTTKSARLMTHIKRKVIS